MADKIVNSEEIKYTFIAENGDTRMITITDPITSLSTLRPLVTDFKSYTVDHKILLSDDGNRSVINDFKEAKLVVKNETTLGGI